jgi:CheY-like chemotaxis protein
MVMDVRMPELDGVAATPEICQASERPRILILTTFDLDEYAFAGLRAGRVICAGGSAHRRAADVSAPGTWAHDRQRHAQVLSEGDRCCAGRRTSG